MKKCISVMSLSESDIIKSIDYIYNLGFSHIEMAPLNLIDCWDNPNWIKHDKIIKLLKKRNIKLSSLQSIFYKKKLNIFDNIDKTIEHMKFVEKLCKKSECSYIVFGGPKNRIINDKLKKNQADENFIKIINSLNINIGIEANPEIYSTNYITDYLDASKLAFKADCFLHFDFGCALSSKYSLEESCKFVKNNKISNIHISLPFLKITNEHILNLYKKHILNFPNKIISLECIYDSFDQFKNQADIFNKFINKIHD